LTQAETARPSSATYGNCGATSDAYRPFCGLDTKLEPPAVVDNFLDYFVHLDGRLWRTLATLSAGKAASGLSGKQARALRKNLETVTRRNRACLRRLSSSWAGIWASVCCDCEAPGLYGGIKSPLSALEIGVARGSSGPKQTSQPIRRLQYATIRLHRMLG
jgi:hypothetical protein